ncbi:hypothetical protein Presley_25 [Acinetobacter phage Presley]|uniref:Uncharacterized protein n=1 Tax=Acinetobacter phage Presley TaxID=1406780 RepID=U5PZM5_9CAUD|nr:hypothetical protein Presley_25 [Acinetobacter phage Presley]AGY48092.1 hypothetical protein Presley_25 [Acinetobacter phage Presley]
MILVGVFLLDSIRQDKYPISTLLDRGFPYNIVTDIMRLVEKNALMGYITIESNNSRVLYHDKYPHIFSNDKWMLFDFNHWNEFTARLNLAGIKIHDTLKRVYINSDSIEIKDAQGNTKVKIGVT